MSTDVFQHIGLLSEIDTARAWGRSLETHRSGMLISEATGRYGLRRAAQRQGPATIGSKLRASARQGDRASAGPGVQGQDYPLQDRRPVSVPLDSFHACCFEPSCHLDDILPALTPKQLALAMRNFARKGIPPAHDVMEACCLEIQAKLPLLAACDLSNIIWALAALKHQPSAQWWQAFECQLYAQMTDLQHNNDKELANLMWGLAVLERRPDGMVLEPLLCAVQTHFFSLSPGEMSNMIWALAKLGHLPSTRWLDNFLMVAQWRFPSFSGSQLCMLAWSVASLGHTPTQEWLVSYEQSVREHFGAFTAAELVCIVGALRSFGASSEHNAVFCMLSRQESFLPVDFEMLQNSKLLDRARRYHLEGARSRGEGGEQPYAIGRRPM